MVSLIIIHQQRAHTQKKNHESFLRSPLALLGGGGRRGGRGGGGLVVVIVVLVAWPRDLGWRRSRRGERPGCRRNGRRPGDRSPCLGCKGRGGRYVGHAIFVGQDGIVWLRQPELFRREMDALCFPDLWQRQAVALAGEIHHDLIVLFSFSKDNEAGTKGHTWRGGGVVNEWLTLAWIASLQSSSDTSVRPACSAYVCASVNTSLVYPGETSTRQTIRTKRLITLRCMNSSS